MDEPSVLRARVGRVAALRGVILLPRTEVAERIAALRRTFATQAGVVAWDALPGFTSFSIEDTTPEDTRRRLSGLGVAPRTPVSALWLDDREGTRLAFQTFVDHYDKLWFPSSDDVWLTDASEIWLLELNHEEVVSFARAAPRPDSRKP